MEVTRKNFKEALPLVKASIKKADFLVIDTEFTGLINGRDVSMFDTPQEYYTRLLRGCSDFLLIQYGLCAFFWDEEKKHYMNESYNFYLFPRGRPGPEKIFLCQSSSLDFLAAQGFDFNKLIKEGISFMTEPTETRLREVLTGRQKLYSSEKDIIIIPEENKPQIEEICKNVRKFLDEKKSNEMEIDRCNAFIRRLLFQELGNKFKKEVFVETKILENKNRVLKVTRITSENQDQDRDAQKKVKEWEEIEEAVGFSKVARMISQSEKLVVGHNMVLDVMHSLNHFFQPLPDDYESFKEFAHCMFPRLLDTKYMSSLPPFKDKLNSSVLQHLLSTLSQPPFSIPKAESEEGRGYSQAEDKHHEAGYDAYVTGLCFLAMHSHLARMRGDNETRVSPYTAVLKPFLNKLFLAKTAHQDSPYMNLAGAEPKPSRDHVFFMTFPREWQRNDINQLFSPFGPILVQFLDDTSALIALARREQAKDVIRALAKCSLATLIPYVQYKHNMSKKSSQYDTSWWKQDSDKSMNTVDSTPKRICVKEVASPSSVGNQISNQTSKQAKASSVKSEHVLSNSASPPASASAVTTRKRTSSGTFQVDECEPAAKKLDLVGSDSAANRRQPEAVCNGRRKTALANATRHQVKNNKAKDRDNSVIKLFDREAKSNCVSAFKESDSWD